MPTAPPIRAADIAAASERISPIVRRTPLQLSPRLSAVYGARVYLKREDLQVVRSYKLRGAYNVMAQLTDAERAAGVVCASAGNHAQGVAYSCRALEISGRIYLPRNTPRQKRDRISALGAGQIELVFVGNTYDQAAAAAAEDAEQTGATVIAPFDDPRTMAGQGTVAKEILEQLDSPPDTIVIPVGGGGLASGMTVWCREHAPDTRLIGVEPEGAPSMQAALASGMPVKLPAPDPFVDGAAVGQVGSAPFDVLYAGDFEMIDVPEGAVCTHMLDLYQNEGIIAEPAGALSIAALDAIDIKPDETIVCVISGGNNDVSRYGEILERSLVHKGLKHYFLVNFSQEPGALRRLLDAVLGPDDDITLFEYVKRNNRELGPALVGIELGTADSLPGFLERAENAPFEVEILEPGSNAYRYLT